MELDVISTIYDALRILSIFARTNLNFAKLTIFMHLVKKTFNDQRFLLSERTFFNETRCFLPLHFSVSIFRRRTTFFPPSGAPHATIRSTVLSNVLQVWPESL